MSEGVFSMQIKLGIIGEQHAIASLNLVIQEYDEISIKVFLDEQDNQAIKIISEHQEEVNAWLVFDQTNYLKIENWGQSQKPIYYIPYRGASFYKVLCSVLYQKLSVDEVSIDTIPYAPAPTCQSMGLGCAFCFCWPRWSGSA